MKTHLISLVFIALAFTSCATTFYQVYKAVPADKSISKDNFLNYEDENCRVSYDLWSEGGNIGFRFYNKTDENIYLNLQESFFVLNGESHDYYKSRIFSTSVSAHSSASGSTTSSKSVTGVNFLDLIQTNQVSYNSSGATSVSSEYSVSYQEEKVVCIPAKTSRSISEYAIATSVYRDCDLLRYPVKRQIRTKTFTKMESPLVFSNIINYNVGKTGTPVIFKNEFYVSEICNYPLQEMIKSKYLESCGQKSMSMMKYFTQEASDKFYIRYQKDQSGLKY